MIEQYNQTTDPEQRKRLKMSISGTYDTLKGLGMNNYQMQAAMGKDLYKEFTSILTGEVASKTNSEAQQIALYDKVIKKPKEQEQGYGIITTAGGRQMT
jgi:hypothetical protein